MAIRGIRGATVAVEDGAEAIYAATQELLIAMQEANPSLDLEDIASVFFTVTSDLKAAFPALGARRLGWQQVPMLCTQEIAVPDGLPRCIRVLVHWNTDLPQTAVQHVYLGEAVRLRPDLIEN